MARIEYLGISLELFNACSAMYPEVDIICGWPNKNSYRITTKFLKHHYIGDVCFWTAKPACNSHEDDRISRIDSFSTAHGKLHENLISNHAYIIKRDETYLNWRFRDNPSGGYKMFQYSTDEKVDGYMVLNIYRDNQELHGQIIDIISPDLDVFESMMEYAKSFFAEKGCSLVKLWLSDMSYAKALEKVGFVYGMQPFRMTIWDRDMDLSRMYITMADSDIF